MLIITIIFAILALMGWMRASAWKQGLMEVHDNAQNMLARAREFHNETQEV